MEINEPNQYGWLFPLALFFTFVVCPACIWAGFHWMHELEEHEEHHEDPAGGH